LFDNSLQHAVILTAVGLEQGPALGNDAWCAAVKSSNIALHSHQLGLDFSPNTELVNKGSHTAGVFSFEKNLK
jgi:hypothetical protein